MTAQEINHIANLAALRASSSSDSAEQWSAVLTLKLQARALAEREIAADGYSLIGVAFV